MTIGQSLSVEKKRLIYEHVTVSKWRSQQITAALFVGENNTINPAYLNRLIRKIKNRPDWALVWKDKPTSHSGRNRRLNYIEGQGIINIVNENNSLRLMALTKQFIREFYGNNIERCLLIILLDEL